MSAMLYNYSLAMFARDTNVVLWLLVRDGLSDVFFKASVEKRIVGKQDKKFSAGA